MSSCSFAAADAIYRCSLLRTINYHLVSQPLFYDFWLTCRRLEDAAREGSADDDLLRKLIRSARLRFVFASSPLPFCHHELKAYSGSDECDAIAKKASRLYPRLADLAASFSHLLEGLTCSETNPLIDHLISLATTEGADGIVIREARLAKAAQAVFGTQDALSRCSVLKADELRTERTFSRLFFLGPPSWFPDFVFSAPRAPEIHVISYEWLSRRWLPLPAFLSTAASPEEHKAGHNTLDSSEQTESESWPEPDWEEIARRALESSPEAVRVGQDIVNTRLFLLSGGLAVFLDVASESLVIDPQAGGSKLVRKVTSDDIKAGTFILHRTEGGGDYIISLADRVLGERARSFRAMQREWKERLGSVLTKSSQPELSLRLLDVSLRLLDLGAIRADESNLRYWLAARCISPRDKSDFRAIMRLVGLEDEIDRYWIAMRQISAAHHEAGRRLRRSLIELVKSVDLDKLERSGQIDFVLPDNEGGRLTAFLVEGQAPESTLVPVSREGRIFERDVWQPIRA